MRLSICKSGPRRAVGLGFPHKKHRKILKCKGVRRSDFHLFKALFSGQGYSSVTEGLAGTRRALSSISKTARKQTVALWHEALNLVLNVRKGKGCLGCCIGTQEQGWV